MAVDLFSKLFALSAIGTDSQDADFHSGHIASMSSHHIGSPFMTTASSVSLDSDCARLSDLGSKPPVVSQSQSDGGPTFDSLLTKSLFAMPHDVANDSGYASDDEDEQAKTASSAQPHDGVGLSVGTLAVIAGVGSTGTHPRPESDSEESELDEQEVVHPKPIAPLAPSRASLRVLPVVSFDEGIPPSADTSTVSLLSRSSQRGSRLREDFDLRAELGRGGFGVVMSGQSRLDSRNYAVKIIPYTLPPSYTDPNDFVSKLDCFREVRTMAKMRGHDNVVRYFSAWHEEISPEIFDIVRDLECLSNVDEASFRQSLRDRDSCTRQDSSASLVARTEKSLLRIASASSSALWNIFGLGKSDGNEIEIDDEEFQFEMDEDDPFGVHSAALGTMPLPTGSFLMEDLSVEPSLSMTGSIGLDSKTNPTHVLVIQMEMCDQGTLRDYLDEREKIDKDECLRIFHQIVEGLHHIHAHNVLHRDIKPANVFVSSDGDVKLGDFGLSVQQNPDPELSRGDVLPSDPESKRDETTIPHLNLNNLTSGLGSPGYAAPEQLDDDKKYSRPADIYPLGLILFELLSHFDTTMERIMAMRDMKMNGAPPEKFIAQFPREAQLISFCLELDPQARPDTEHILQHPIFHDISRLTRFEKSVASSPTDSDAPLPMRRSRRPSLGVTTNLQSALKHKMIEIDILRSRISQLEAQLEQANHEGLTVSDV